MSKQGLNARLICRFICRNGSIHYRFIETIKYRDTFNINGTPLEKSSRNYTCNNYDDLRRCLFNLSDTDVHRDENNLSSVWLKVLYLYCGTWCMIHDGTDKGYFGGKKFAEPRLSKGFCFEHVGTLYHLANFPTNFDSSLWNNKK